MKKSHPVSGLMETAVLGIIIRIAVNTKFICIHIRIMTFLDFQEFANYQSLKTENKKLLMKKSEFLQQCWIHISNRIPPDTKKQVIVAIRTGKNRFNDERYTLSVMPGWLARGDAKMNLDPEKRKGLSWDRKWVWWMPTEQPPRRKIK